MKGHVHSIKRQKRDIIIFSDLDGTLLDRADYSFERAGPALMAIKKRGIPLILCTSKTRKEVEFYRRLLGNTGPFVVENGGAVFIPKGYFPFSFDYDQESAEYFIIELGTPYTRTMELFDALNKKTGGLLKGFSGMSVAQIASLCHLSQEQAAMAKQREYDEPFLIMESEDYSRIEEIIKKRYTKGDRFYHCTESNKGKAVSILIDLFKRSCRDVLSVGLGNRANDLSLLLQTEIPILVQMEDGNHDPAVFFPQLQYIKGIGPEGWNRAIMKLLKEH